MDRQLSFPEVWAVDFEFTASDGERPIPLCVVARELRTGRLARVWLDDAPPADPPYNVGPDALFIAYYASAELGCHLALNWPMPARILDLFAEFRCLTAGLPVPCGNGLLGALAYFGLDALDAAEKDSMRQLAMRGGPYTPAERFALLDYCQSDVDALARLLPAMLQKIVPPDFDGEAKRKALGQALLRGRYMAAAARMEWNGVPIDTETLDKSREKWDSIKGRLIERIDKDVGVYEGQTFKAERWAAYLTRKGIPWPRHNSGRLALDDDTFREMARSYPAEIAPIRELRHTLGQLRLNELAVGSHGRNRCLLSVFGSKTGRNTPSNSRFIFGPSTWLRGLIRPEPGRAVAYVDWEQQEFGIAAALSRDPAMQEAYHTGDPYLAFARQAGAVSLDASKETHKPIRDAFKACVLAVQYGMGEVSLAQRLGQCPARARELLALHRQTYPAYWRWSESAVNHAMLLGYLPTVFGWRVHVGPDANARSLANFPMQANGAEMLRLACCLATERGIQVCAPIHDALLVEGEAGGIEAVVVATQAVMREASAIVLSGFELRTDARIVRYPDRYMDERGKGMWETVWGIVADLETKHTEQIDVSQNGIPHLSQTGTGTCPILGHPSPLISLISSSLLK
jgi:hypothetical protein